MIGFPDTMKVLLAAVAIAAAVAATLRMDDNQELEILATSGMNVTMLFRKKGSLDKDFFIFGPRKHMLYLSGRLGVAELIQKGLPIGTTGTIREGDPDKAGPYEGRVAVLSNCPEHMVILLMNVSVNDTGDYKSLPSGDINKLAVKDTVYEFMKSTDGYGSCDDCRCEKVVTQPASNHSNIIDIILQIPSCIFYMLLTILIWRLGVFGIIKNPVSIKHKFNDMFGKGCRKETEDPGEGDPLSAMGIQHHNQHDCNPATDAGDSLSADNMDNYTSNP